MASSRIEDGAGAMIRAMGRVSGSTISLARKSATVTPSSSTAVAPSQATLGTRPLTTRGSSMRRPVIRLVERALPRASHSAQARFAFATPCISGSRPPSGKSPRHAGMSWGRSCTSNWSAASRASRNAREYMPAPTSTAGRSGSGELSSLEFTLVRASTGPSPATTL